MDFQSSQNERDNVLRLLDRLTEQLASPLSEEDVQSGWMINGKAHWHGVAQDWTTAVMKNQRAPAIPLSGKHLDNSGAGSDGQLFGLLEKAANAIDSLQRQRSIWHRLFRQQ